MSMLKDFIIIVFFISPSTHLMLIPSYTIIGAAIFVLKNKFEWWVLEQPKLELRLFLRLNKRNYFQYSYWGCTTFKLIVFRTNIVSNLCRSNKNCSIQLSTFTKTILGNLSVKKTFEFSKHFSNAFLHSFSFFSQTSIFRFLLTCIWKIFFSL